MKILKLKHLIILIFLAYFSPQTISQNYYQLKDINPGVAGSSIFGFTKMKGKIYFIAISESSKRHLFETDGNELNTTVISDFSSIFPALNSPIAVSDSLLIFLGSSTSTGLELFQSNGTIGSEELIADINPGATSSVSQFGQGDGELVYFLKNNNFTTKSLYRTDGTEEGTFELVADIAGFGLMKKHDGFTYTRLRTSNNTWLLKTDGTQEGTEILTKIHPQNVTYSTVMLESLNGFLYFLKEDDNDGSWGLWKTDGTMNGLTKVVDLNPPGNNNAHSLVFSDGKLFFIANDGENGQEIYVSDGTATGTHIVTDFENANSSNAAGSNLTPFRNGILFERNEQLWFTNGSPDSVFLLKEFSSLIFGQALGLNINIRIDSILYFSAKTTSHGKELWRTDGTAAGTIMLTDICLGPCDSNPRHFVKLDDYRIMFTATETQSGNEPWVYEFETPPIVGVKPVQGNPKSDLSVFPNPIYLNEFQINWKQNLTPKNIELMNINGKIIYSKKIKTFENYTQIYVPDIASGIYFAFLSDEAGRILGSCKISIL